MSEAEVVDEPEVVDVMPVVREPSPSTALVARDEISIKELLEQSAIIEAAMRQAMKENVHYGKIPGVQKPTLLKPGAEKLNVLFRLAASYHSEKIWHGDGHLTVVARCVLTHIPTSLVVGEGEGLCTTKESKYAYRNQERNCPECGLPQVRLGKPRDGKPGNWYCWRKQGGCGATWALDSDQAKLFEAMDTGRGDNPDLPDQYNTVLKMADKRALVAAVLNCTAASDVFTQDVEERPSGGDPFTDADTAPAREFDPGLDLLPGAIDAKDFWRRIGLALQAIDGTMDWQTIIDQAAAGVWPDVTTWRDVPEADMAKFCRRLANAVERITVTGGTFVSDEEIVAGFAFAFGGVRVEIDARDAAADADTDIPFGESGVEDAAADTAATPGG